MIPGAKSEEEYGRLVTYFISQHFFHPKDPVDSFTRAAGIYFDCRKKVITIRSTIHCIIAQTTTENDLYLLHNEKDFEIMAKVVTLKFY